MRNLLFYSCLIFILFTVSLPEGLAQTQQDRPKIVVGMVVDQMRWDYLYRYQDRYSEGGFKRLLRQGFACENTHIPYAQTATGPGHACVYTGSVPSVHGVIENDWYDRSIGKKVNCVEDPSAESVGGPQEGARRSPHQLLTTTIGDELKLANQSRSKVIGISIKDRGAILPAGHMADGAFWYDKRTGKFVTSSYYMKELPEWLDRFNDRKLADHFVTQTWEPLFPIETYKQSTEDDRPYEGTMIGKEKPVFPYDFSTTDKDYGALRSAIYGNTLVFEMGKAAAEGEALGERDFTDMLTLSFSATDAMGHRVGPNAIEIEDMYLRLDRELSDFLQFLDEKYGEDGYLFFLTADHGASQSPGFLLDHQLPAGAFELTFLDDINRMGKEKFGLEKTILTMVNAEIYLNWEEIREKRDVDENDLMEEVLRILGDHEGFMDAWPKKDLANAPWPDLIKARFVNGHNTLRSGDIAVIIRPGWKTSVKGADHGLWYPFDSHIPLVWMGWNIPSGETNRPVEMTDIAPTLAALLKVQMPSGSIGEPIFEITEQKK